MKVILLKNVSKIGQKGEIKDLKEGYVRNMLLPRGLAKIASPADVANAVKAVQISKEHEEARTREIGKMFSDISGKIVTIREKASEKGHLFAQVGIDKIVDAINTQLNIKVESAWVSAPEHLKEVGQHKIGLHYKNKKGEIILEVAGL